MASLASAPLSAPRVARGDPAALFAATIFLGSFLLFLMEPMIARMALPRVGGAPAVWNSAMLVYQALLLAGYAYAHAIGRWPVRRQAVVHVALLAVAACWLPIGLGRAVPPADAQPALWVPLLLLGTIGPLFFVIAAQAPLLQRWFGVIAPAANPYSLYVASNLGSFGGLIAYPLLLEPLFGLRQQSLGWSLLYAGVAICMAACALAVRHQGAPVMRTAGESVAPSRVRRLRWVMLAAVPSGLMLSTTTHLTTNIMALPMIWVVPLGLYLLSFSLGFSEGRPAALIARAFPAALLLGAGIAFAAGTTTPFASAAEELGMMLVVSVTLHRQLYRARPAADRLTGFYLLMSLGGVIGGIFCGLLAPLLFDWAYEHPLLIVAAALLVRDGPLLPAFGRIASRHHRAIALAAMALPLLTLPVVPHHLSLMPLVAFPLALLAILAAGRPRLFALCIAGFMLAKGGWATLAVSLDGHQRERSYFGVSEIAEQDGARLLEHGTTIHGMQRLAPAERLWPLTYYAPGSGVGQAMRAVPALFGPRAHIGVIGLGAGTLACYARPGQAWRFYEIDPTVIRMATDPARFSFLAGCAPHAPIILGDARISLTAAPAAPLDLLVVDAFSSDSPPMHLMTVEAFDTYARAIRPGGLIVVNISNRFMDFEPAFAALAREGGWSARAFDYQPDARRMKLGVYRSVWIALSRRPASLAPLAGWRPLRGGSGMAAWTDDRASILPVLRLGR